jgi:RimJ/RimL family protein N-acetyltransferase
MNSLRGTRCKLRPISRADLSLSVGWRNDPEIRASVLGYPFPVTNDMEAAWYDRLHAEQGVRRASFAIEDATDDALAGFVHLTDIDWIVRAANFGIVVGERARWGQGIGREATTLAIRYAFDTLNLRRIGLRVVAGNAAAEHIYRSLGFVEEGRLRQAAFVNGAFADVLLMSLLAGELRSKPSPALTGQKDAD